MCGWDTAKFLIFSGNVFAPLIYYSHFFALIPSFAIGLIILLKDKKSLVNQILFLITILFSVWVFFDLILWATEKPEFTMFFWAVIVLIEPLIYALCVYFIDVFVGKEDVSFKKKLGIFLPLLPIIILLPTNLILNGFDLTNCDRAAIQGPVSTYYVYAIEIAYVFWIFLFAFRKYFKTNKETKKQVLLMTTGIILFLLSFSLGNIIESITDNWVVGQYGLFGMPIFVGFLAYMIVKFKTFNIKVIGAQVLVFALGFLVLAILFIRNIQDVRLVVILTLLFVLVLGNILIRSVKREVEQKEQLAKLNIDLQNVIQQRESLMHLINHKVKGSFTHTKYIFAGMLDGMFGTITPEIKKIAELGLDSDNNGIRTIDLILNTANLKKGMVSYEMKSIDLKELITKTVEEKKTQAEKKGIKIETEITGDVCMINGDSFWLKEVINNLIDNSIRYTKEGGIRVGLKKENSKLLFYVKDTGIGITPEDKNNLFTEGGRGKESVKTNVDSTGYGLFTVKLIVEAHSGKVWVESEGEGKGATFFVQFDAI